MPDVLTTLRRQATTERLFFLFIVLLLLSYIGCQRQDLKMQQGVISGLNSDLKQKINAYGELESSRKILMGDYKTLKQLTGIKDSTIAQLSRELKKKSIGRGTIIQEIHDTVEIPAIEYVEVPCDTIYRKYQLEDKWGKFRITTRADKAFLAYSIKNATTIDLRYQSQGLFKRSLPVVTVTDHNPNSTTREVEFLVVKKPPVPWWSYLVVFTGGVLTGGVIN